MEAKYSQHFIPAPLEQGEFAPVLRFYSGKHFNQPLNFTMVRNGISGPFFMDKGSHKHEFDQFLFFLGGDPLNVGEFGASVEFCIGDEQEKHIINSSTVVYIPKGLKHCPLNFVTVDKPIFFINISLTPQYGRVKE